MTREKTYGCNRCWDVGVRTIIHPEAVAKIKADAEEWVRNGTIYTAARRCVCAKGDRYPGFPIYHGGLVEIPHVCRGTAEEQRQCYVDEVWAHEAPQDFNKQFN
jgi:hypothetical protein